MMFHFLSKIDRRLAEYCRTGDPEALREVFDATSVDLARIALYICRDSEGAHDVVQETFLAVIESRARYRPGDRAIPWLMGILANKAKYARRLRGRTPPAVAEPIEEPSRLASERELLDRLTTLARELGEPYAEVLSLHLHEGLNAKEVAERLGRPAGTVRTQLMRALAKLREVLPASLVAGGLAVVGRPVSAATAASLTGIRQVVMTSARESAAGSGAHATTTPHSSARRGRWPSIRNWGAAIVAIAAGLTVTLAFLLQQAPDAPPVGRSEARATAIEADLEQPANWRERAAVVGLAPLEPLPVEAGYASLRVRARRPDGRPVPGATVVGSSGRLVNQRDAVTDLSGVAELRQLKPGEWHFETDFAPAEGEKGQVDITLAAGTAGVLEFTVQVDAERSGVVRDEHGRPVADCSIVRELSGDWSNGCWANEIARSDSAGRFRIALSYPRNGSFYFSIGARKTGYSPSETWYLARTDAEGDEPITFTLTSGGGGDLEGVVLSPSGAPISWAMVVAGDYAKTLGPGRGSPCAADTRTNVDGRFRLEGLSVGAQHLRVFAPGYAFFERLVEVRAGAWVTNPLAITLQGVATVHGTIRDTNGQACKGLHVVVGPHESSMEGFCGELIGWPDSSTDDNGDYELADVPTGSHNVRILDESREIQRSDAINLTAGQVYRWDVVLPAATESPPWTLSARVSTVEGHPVPSVALALVGAYQDRRSGIGDSAFVWEVNGRPALNIYVGDQFIKTISNIDSSTPNLDIRLADAELPSSTVRGRLLDAAGLPWEGVVTVNGESCRTSHCDARGEFAIGPLLAGSYVVSVQASEDMPSYRIRRLEVGTRQDYALGDLRIGSPGRIEVRATWNGCILQGGTVDITPIPDDLSSGSEWATHLPIIDGHAVVPLTEPRRYHAHVEFADHVAAREFAVRSGEPTYVDLELRPSVRTVIQLATPDPSDIDWDAHIALRAPDGTLVTDNEATSDRPTLEVKAPLGAYKLQVTLTDGRKVEQGLFISSDGATSRVVLPAPGKQNDRGQSGK